MPNKSQSAPSPTSMLKRTATSFVGKQLVEGARKFVSRIGGSHGSGDSQPTHATSIIEDIDVGVPVRVAYEEWTQFRNFPEFAKSAKQVDKGGSKQVRWEVKVWWSTR